MMLHVLPAQDSVSFHNNRLYSGMGGENGFLGVDYSRSIYKRKVFLGIGVGIGTGWTGYVRLEPFNNYELSPFVSPAISYSSLGTFLTSSGTTVFSLSAGLSYIPRGMFGGSMGVSVGYTYYVVTRGAAGDGLNNFGPLFKIGYGF
jgi:hypothetical protein